jgi:hypothetical protein
VADWSTIASLGTAGGTLVLAIATFGSTRTANRAARVSEEALMVGIRPVLFNARPDDRPQKVRFADNHWLRLHDGLAAVQEADGNIYMAMPLRNVAQGIAVLHGWYLHPSVARAEVPHAPVGEFRGHMRDLYVPAGDVNFWQGAVRDPSDPLYAPLREAIAREDGISLDLLYGDHEGGQRTITRFYLSPRPVGDDEEPWLWTCAVVRHWNLDRADPR